MSAGAAQRRLARNLILNDSVLIPPFCGFWPRGGAKSSNAERGAAAVGAWNLRPYLLYVCGTQEQADDHVANVASVLTSEYFEEYYPHLAKPALNKLGDRRGWRRQRIMAGGRLRPFTVDALGLDTAARGIRVDDDRPGFLIIDDIDGEWDSPAQTDKKVSLLTKKILPAGAPNLVVAFMQNLIGPNTVAARLARTPGADTIDMLHDRIVSGPYKALEGFAVEQRANLDGWEIRAGEPIWEGQNLAVCQRYIDTFGLHAFRSECQNEVDTIAGGMFDIPFKYIREQDIRWGSILRVVVWVDPAVTATNRSDCQAVIVDAIDDEGRIFRLRSWEGRAKPEEALIRALLWAVEFKAEKVGVETDQGGDTWESVFARAVQLLAAGRDEDPTGSGLVFGPTDASAVAFDSAKAGAGAGPKAHRWQQMLTDYQAGGIWHVLGPHGVLERSLKRAGLMKPYDLADAAFWSWDDLRNGGVFASAVAGEYSVAELNPNRERELAGVGSGAVFDSYEGATAAWEQGLGRQEWRPIDAR